MSDERTDETDRVFAQSMTTSGLMYRERPELIVGLLALVTEWAEADRREPARRLTECGCADCDIAARLLDTFEDFFQFGALIPEGELDGNAT